MKEMLKWGDVPVTTALARIYKAVNSALQTNSKLNGCEDQANTLSKSVGVQQQIESNEQAGLQQEKVEESGALFIGQVIPKTTGLLDMKTKNKLLLIRTKNQAHRLLNTQQINLG